MDGVSPIMVNKRATGWQKCHKAQYFNKKNNILNKNSFTRLLQSISKICNCVSFESVDFKVLMSEINNAHFIKSSTLKAVDW